MTYNYHNGLYEAYMHDRYVWGVIFLISYNWLMLFDILPGIANKYFVVIFVFCVVKWPREV